MKASGSPPGTTTPSASRYRPASCAAIQRSSPWIADVRDPALAAQLVQHGVRVAAGERARARLLRRQVAHPAQDVVQGVAIRRLRALGAVLEVVLDLGQGARVDQLAQLLLAEQLAQEVAVERQRRRAALGVGRVALVHVGRDVVEEQ